MPARPSGCSSIFLTNAASRTASFPSWRRPFGAWTNGSSSPCRAATPTGQRQSSTIGPAPRACICWEYDFWQVWRVPLAVTADGQLLPTFSALLADRQPDKPGVFALDLSYDTRTITQYSAIDLMSGKLDPELLRGKDVIFAPTASASPDQHYLPSHDKVYGAYIHLIAGEALKRGNPIDIGWIPPPA